MFSSSMSIVSFIPVHIRFIIKSLCCVGFLLTFCAIATAQNFNGFAELRFAEYSAEKGGQKTEDQSHFTQKYSLTWSKSSLINGGRAGNYNLGVGAEWTSVNAEINGNDSDVDSFKFFYRGDLVFAPGGLPFRLHAYSFDNSPATFSEDLNRSVAEVSPYLAPGSSILKPDIITGLSNGQYIVTGVTLLAGIRNGSYLGQYRDVLSKYPRLLMDYREIYARDLDAAQPVHYRDRKLAFVSLNKKDNWFHYRAQKYEDFENEQGDFEETTILLGTVDHTLERKWINMTNWLQLSVDGSYTQTKDSFRDGRESNEFAVNAFSVGRRKGWEMSNFSTFSRSNDGDELFSKRLRLPFYGKGDLSKDTSWRTQLIAEWSDQSQTQTFSDVTEELVYSRSQLDLFQRSRHIVRPEVSFGLRQGDRGEGFGADLGVQVFSNYRYRPKNTIFGSANFSVVNGDGEEEKSLRYVESRLLGRISRLIRPNLTVGVEERLILGNGTLDGSMAPGISVAGSLPLMMSSADSSSTTRHGNVLHSTTTLFAEHDYKRMKNRFEVLYDLLELSDDPDKNGGAVMNLRHRFDYKATGIRASHYSDVLLGDADLSRNFSSNYLGSVGVKQGSNQWSFLAQGLLDYSPSRSFDASAKYKLSLSDNGILQFHLNQAVRYNYYTVNGRIRRLGSLYEEITYENFSGVGNDPSVTVFTLGGNYYPGHYVSLGASMEQQYYSDGAFGQTAAKLSAEINFPKLVVGMDYSYGVRDEHANYAERTEQRWEVKVKKTL